MRKIVKAIATVEEFNANLFNKLNIGVEIQDFTEPNLSFKEKNELIRLYKDLFQGFKAIKALHGPFLDLKPASPDLDIRKISHKKYLETLDIAHDLNIKYIIFHSQINPYLKEEFIRDLNNNQSKEFWHKILKETEYKNKILIENVFEEEPHMLKRHIEAIDRENIKVNLDLGHAKLSHASLEEWIRELKDHIEYIHVHSNNAIYDQHKSMTKEEVLNLYNLLEKYNINPVLSLEYKVEDLEKEIYKYR